jgi:hypothetical protein
VKKIKKPEKNEVPRGNLQGDEQGNQELFQILSQ